MSDASISEDKQTTFIELRTIKENETITQVPWVKSQLYGDIYAPRTLVELSATLTAFGFAFSTERYVWRGHADIDWRLDSHITRQYEHAYRVILANIDKSQIRSREDFVSAIEDRWLNDARNRGHQYQNGRELTDLELFALFQHLGGATRLVDFTWNLYTALWFACGNGSSTLHRTGLVIGVSLNKEYAYQFNSPADWQKDWNLVRQTPDNRIAVWQPIYTNSRMQAQQSVFLFGKVQENNWSNLFQHNVNLEVKKRKPLFIRIAVTSELKFQLMTRWSKIFGYDQTTFFPDTVGFAQNWRQTNFDFFELM